MLLAVTASFHNRPLAVVERLSLTAPDLATALVADGLANGAVALSTCNRYEIYLDTDNLAATRAGLIAGVARRLSMTVEDAANAFDELHEDQAVTHLCRVAASLDSMVVGEQEISGQVRRALKRAHQDHTATGSLTRLFEHAIRASRTVAAHTGIGSSTRSVASVALDLAGAHTDFRGAQALLVGTGQLAAGGVAALRARGANIIGVFSPSGRARDFGELYGIPPLALEDLNEALSYADVVYACSGGEGVVLSASQLAAARSGVPFPLTVIDLALHRDVEPDAAQLAGVSVIDLSDVRSHAPRENPQAYARAEQIAALAAQNLAAELATRAARKENS